MKLSIVTTLYNSAAYIHEFYNKITNVANSFAGDDYELIFVDDGSPDDSGKIVKSLIENDNHVVLIELSRNFGHHSAALAGVMYSSGEYVFYLDCDLEDDPQWLFKYYEEMKLSDADIVFGSRNKRQGTLLKRMTGEVFYKFFNTFSDIKIVPNIASAILAKRSFVHAMKNIKEKNLFMPANLAWLGFKTSCVNNLERLPRNTKSNYTLFKMLNLAINAITSFTSYPLQIIFLLGLIISITFGTLGAYMLIKKILFPYKVFFGYASLIVSIWFLGGIIILFIGIIGIYLAKIFTEVKDRPQYVIREVYKKNK